MANGKIRFGKQSGGELALVIPDGVANTEVIVPESGTLVSVDGSVTDNSIARYDGTTGKLQNSGVVIDDSWNVGVGTIPKAWRTISKTINIGASGNIESLTNNGSYVSVNANNYNNGVNDIYINHAASTKYQQIAGVHSWFMAPSAPAGTPITWTETMKLDTSGNLLLTSGTGALGYGTGAGGTVTQLTSKNAAVSLNKPTGTITMHNQALAAGASAVFNFTNAMIDTFSLIKFQIIAGYNSYNSYKIESDDINGQIVRVKLTNVSDVSLSEAIILNFNIIKGANA